MSQTPRSGGNPNPPSPVRGGPRQGLRKRLRSKLLDLLRPELTELGAELAELRGQLGLTAASANRLTEEQNALRSDVDGEISKLRSKVDGQISAVRGEAERLAEDHGTLRGHLEKRIDQVIAEAADLRGAFLTTRGEFEEVRDRKFGGLEGAIIALQGELERVRDELVPRIEGDAARLQQAIGSHAADLGSQQRAVETLQRELAELRDDRVARLAGDLASSQQAVETLQRELAEARDLRLAQSEREAKGLHTALVTVQEELRAVREGRLAESERSVASLQQAILALQGEVESVRDRRLADAESTLDGLQRGLEAVQSLGEELRDRRLPALSARTDVLVERLHEELTVIGGLVDRLVAGEPLRVSAPPEVEERIPEALREAALAIADTLRGRREEILDRAREHLHVLRDAPPVLDLGCGRGELLQILRSEGIEARGVDVDPAMVAACKDLGLAVTEAEALAELRGSRPGSQGAVAAIHLFEHLPAPTWMSVMAEAQRVLRPGGVLVVECPNPSSLRVGGDLFWIDPTHRAPVHPDAVAFVARAVGLEVVETRFLRPFPADQSLVRDGQPEAVRELAVRLDEWLSGPRDFVVVARKPGTAPHRRVQRAARKGAV